MFHGIGVTLARLVGPERIRVLPQPSSASWPALGACWVVGGRDADGEFGEPTSRDGAARAVERRQITGPESERRFTRGYREAARRQRLRQFAPRRPRTTRRTARANLRRHRRTVAARASNPLNIVAITCALPERGFRRLTRTPDSPDTAFGGDGQLTKQEVRALTLSALAPAPGELLWTWRIGSIAIEWSRTHPRCRIPFERLLCMERADCRQFVCFGSACGDSARGGPGALPTRRNRTRSSSAAD